VPATDVAAHASDDPFDHPDQKEPIMFPSSTLHTDFAQQLQHDRRAGISIARRSPREGRSRVAVLRGALLRSFRRTAPSAAAATPADATRSAAAC
jgi:hypothetical protein